MAGNYTYTNDPGGNNIDLVRFLANDNVAPMHLSDEEIQYLVQVDGDPNFAAADAADMIAGRLSTKADKIIGPLSIRYRQQGEGFEKLAKAIRSRAAKFGGGPVLTQTDRDSLFVIGMHDTYNGWMPPEVSNGEPDWTSSSDGGGGVYGSGDDEMVAIDNGDGTYTITNVAE